VVVCHVQQKENLNFSFGRGRKRQDFLTLSGREKAEKWGRMQPARRTGLNDFLFDLLDGQDFFFSFHALLKMNLIFDFRLSVGLVIEFGQLRRTDRKIEVRSDRVSELGGDRVRAAHVVQFSGRINGGNASVQI